MADVFCNAHKPQIFYTLDSLLAYCVGEQPDLNKKIKWTRFWTRKWNAFKLHHPTEPYILRCAVCSGEEKARAYPNKPRSKNGRIDEEE